MHGIVPSNGERHVYPKHFTLPQAAVFSLSAALVSVQCEVSGTGTLEIDWGDDSAAETVILGHTPYTLHHTFNSRVRHKRRIRWFADASFRHIDWSGMNPSSVILLRELHVEELTLRLCPCTGRFPDFVGHLPDRPVRKHDIRPLVARRTPWPDGTRPVGGADQADRIGRIPDGYRGTLRQPA